MAKIMGGWILVAVGVTLMGWSLAIGFFDYELARYIGGFVGLIALITGIDMARDSQHPWWSGGKSSFIR